MIDRNNPACESLFKSNPRVSNPSQLLKLRILIMHCIQYISNRQKSLSGVFNGIDFCDKKFVLLKILLGNFFINVYTSYNGATVSVKSTHSDSILGKACSSWN
jgi:hypothetical protein